MLRKGWFRWLIPGLNIKRWLALFSCGVGLLIIGISLIFNYQWLAVLEDIVLAFSYNMTGFYNYNVLIAVGVVVLSIGAVLMLIGTSKVIKTIIRAVLPNPDSKVSDIIFQNIRIFHKFLLRYLLQFVKVHSYHHHKYFDASLSPCLDNYS